MTKRDDRPQCFAAMWFGADEDSVDEMNQLFDMVIKPAIEHHGLRVRAKTNSINI